MVKALEPERASFRPSVARAYSVAASVSVRANAFLGMPPWPSVGRVKRWLTLTQICRDTLPMPGEG